MKYLVAVVRLFRMWRVGVVLTAAVPGLLVACGSGDDRADVRPVAEDADVTTTTAVQTTEESTTTTTTTAADGAESPTPTVPTAAPSDDPVRAEVEAAYRNAVQAFIDAAAIPDPAFPALAQWNAGPMLDLRTNTLSAMKIQGRRARYPSNSIREVVVVGFERLSESDAVLETCQIDDGIVYEAASGAVINDAVSAIRMRATLRRGATNWQVVGRDELGEEADMSCD